MAPHLQIKNLIFLLRGNNGCYPDVIETMPSQVQIDLAKGTWKIDQGIPNEAREIHTIGQGVRSTEHNDYGGIIGIYDRTNIAHLKTMAFAVTEVFASGYSSFDSD